MKKDKKDWLLLNTNFFKSAEMRASKGESKAQTIMGMLFFYGHEEIGISVNEEKAFSFAKKAAYQDDDDAQLYLGIMYLVSEKYKDTSLAKKWFEKAAKQNNPTALIFLATSQKYGIGGKEDFEQSKLNYRKALELNPNNETALIENGIILMNEFIKNKDIVTSQKAISLFEKCSEKNDASAGLSYVYLGIIYEYGLGPKIDNVKANYFFNKARKFDLLNAGFMPSKSGIEFVSDAVIYDKGIGVKQDRLKAMKLYKKAKESGFDSNSFLKTTDHK